MYDIFPSFPAIVIYCFTRRHFCLKIAFAIWNVWHAKNVFAVTMAQGCFIIVRVWKKWDAGVEEDDKKKKNQGYWLTWTYLTSMSWEEKRENTKNMTLTEVNWKKVNFGLQCWHSLKGGDCPKNDKVLISLSDILYGMQSLKTKPYKSLNIHYYRCVRNAQSCFCFQKLQGNGKGNMKRLNIQHLEVWTC